MEVKTLELHDLKWIYVGEKGVGNGIVTEKNSMILFLSFFF